MLTKWLKIESVILCDDARREENGKEILIGVYAGIINFQQLPANVPHMAIRIAGRLQVPAIDKMEITLVDANNNLIFSGHGAIIAPDTTVPFAIVIQHYNVPFDTAGIYKIYAQIENVREQISEFEVRQTPPVN